MVRARHFGPISSLLTGLIFKSVAMRSAECIQNRDRQGAIGRERRNISPCPPVLVETMMAASTTPISVEYLLTSSVSAGCWRLTLLHFAGYRCRRRHESFLGRSANLLRRFARDSRQNFGNLECIKVFSFSTYTRNCYILLNPETRRRRYKHRAPAAPLVSR